MIHRTYVLSNLPFGRTFYKLDRTINLLTDNTLKKITHDVLVRCPVIVSDHNAKIGRTFSKNRGSVAQLVEHWVAMYEVVSLTPAAPKLRVLK